jgi:TolB-like protein/Tfp pilus assembly protein PilF
VALAGAFLARHHQLQPGSQPDVVANSERTMVAVLPFENLTGDATQDYFSDGLTEEMIAQLGRVEPERLGVIARTSVMHYKHNDEPLEQIGRELGVQYVLEGSFRRDAGKVRIAAKLIQIKDQRDIWSQQYDRDLSGLLTLQGEIATEISDEIQNALGEREQNSSAVAAAPLPAVARPLKSYEAYGDYLKGRYFWNMRTAQGFQQGIMCFQQSIAKDPAYAPAYAGLADSYALMSSYGGGPASELIPKARAAALKALSLDDNLAEAHASLAVITQNYDWDWQTSEKEFRRAIALDPNYATGHHWYAEHLALLGRFDEAEYEMGRARQLDPLSLIMQTDATVFLYFARRYDQSIDQFRAVIEREPNFPRTNILASAYAQDGRYDDALAEIKKWRRADDQIWIPPLEAQIDAQQGRPGDARRALQDLRALTRGRPVKPWAFVEGYAGVGDKDQAFLWLQKSISEHSPGLTSLKVNPTLDPIRSDPRFPPILRQMGLN